MKYFDAHTHIQFAAYSDVEKGEVIQRARDAGVGMNVVGTQYDTSLAGVEMARRYDDIWATIGLHPVHTARSYHDVQEFGEGGVEFTSRGEKFDSEKYKQLGRDPKVIAIGECGLDYYRVDPDTKSLQSDVFVQHIELANTLGKPLMLHVRPSLKSQGAYLDALELLQSHAKVPGDVHFFVGSYDTAKQFLDIGFRLSFTGVITFTHDYDEVIRSVPPDRILSETDAPYVTPVPFRGKRNEPVYIPHIVEAIAHIRGEGVEQVATQIRRNVTDLFGV